MRSQTLNQIVDSRVVSQIQPKCLQRFAYTASKSLQNDPKKRPSMSEVVALLESALAFQSSSSMVQGDIFQFESEEEISSITEYLGKARSIFGEPIGNKTLAQMRLNPTRENKARIGYKMMNEGNKYDNALRFVKDLKAQWGNGITCLCMLYNATGETLTYAASRNWFGDIGPSPYPTFILNGQWGAYLHTKTPRVPSGSQAAVVYRGKYSDNASCDRMITWSIPWQRFTQDNAAYCEINEVGHFDHGAVWDEIYDKSPSAGRESSYTWNDCYTRVTVESDTSPIYKAILTRVDALVSSA
ncbi:unnamed protein product [Lactuca virosa]|uniref:Uncharacterized protein n=1 Tax=Lactuca virosa TaxID=75947 RepID=A0AAU9MUN7_9ASTR|nr:unnamed protein product [Lactuca virosa]